MSNVKQSSKVIEAVGIDELIPYARNSRTHSDAQVAQIAASIREFGFTNPVLIDEEGGIIAGHGRVLGARKLGLDVVPCIRLTHFTETQRRAYVIADNKIALNAGWDNELLRLELTDIGQQEGFDMGLTGFTEGELSALFLEVEPGETDKDDEWEGMPEFDVENKTSFRQLIVHFECQDDYDDFARVVGQKLTDKTKSIWHPEQIRMDTEAKRYA